MKLIQRLVNPFDGSGPDDTYAIIGSDSDLFIMALLQDRYSNLWILPEGEVSAGSGALMEGFTATALDSNLDEASGGTIQVESYLHSLSLLKFDKILAASLLPKAFCVYPSKLMLSDC